MVKMICSSVITIQVTRSLFPFLLHGLDPLIVHVAYLFLLIPKIYLKIILLK